jgi:hypothetical protein
LKQDFVGGSNKDKKCPTFSGEYGIEALLYIEERFRKIASRTLSWTPGPELLEGFEEILLDTALSNWEDIIALIAEADKTPARFELALQEMYRKYVGAEARDVQFEYYRSISKPLKSSTLDHSSRMLTLARYGNKLPGTEPVLTDDQVKKCIFSSFPLTWQQQYIRSGQRVANTSLSDIIEFMSNEKIFADAQNSNKEKKPFSTKDKNGDSYKKRLANGKQKFNGAKRNKPAKLNLTPNALFTEDTLGVNVLTIQAAITTSQEMAIDHLVAVEDEDEEDILTPVAAMAVVARATAVETDNTRSRQLQNCQRRWMQLQSQKYANNTTLIRLTKTQNGDGTQLRTNQVIESN